MARTATALILGVFVAALGCSDGDIQCNGVLVGNTCFPDTPGCTSDPECLPTGVCLNGACGQECTSDAMCLNGYVCQTYRCILDGGGPGKDTVDPPEDAAALQDTADAIPCQGHVDCDPYDMACIDGFCGKECTQDWHCDDPGLECEFYQCVPGGGPGEDTISPPEDTGDCPPKDGAYGDLCGCKEQCATQLCVQNFLTGQNTCTQYCTGDVNCPGTDICIVVEGGSICYYNDAGVTPPSCNPDQAGCFKGMVLTNQLGQCACTVPCVDAAGSCPGGMACHYDQQSNQKYCVAVGAPCSTAQNPCYSGSCLGDGQTGYCTAICNTLADCPAGWSCQDVGGAFACAAP